ncbi:acetyl-CoA hydrolase/transferase family protein [Tessaracoccus sp. MC1865]|uniref:acetyl-CoA hydrolase/transferase family protein n=1 Tax=unclassified Tessaracoccus TaxID=2635419 RepID=UPI00160433A8|nr:MULTISPECIES: acetyl-CoA hydrolase/transferase family protein [unclassified Tessaracoccus]MBB1484122.1 acetyl-CoA hydrolase/transferase family protein [Tessaracoccus sp. MC1865]MBB1508367.1 acetyl-CoA hydrolase/transferase family protein [Tessaracoccus sp. MC1756]QTO37150.1 acetyl-CoA hydrolase/transferase family protein [Tessaracoccus sp. MC1865]
MSGRIRYEAFKNKVMSAHDAAALVENGWNIGFSGFTGSGYPKAFPEALAAIIDAAHNRGEEFKIGVWTGASTAPELDGALARTGGISYRAPYQSDPDMRNTINSGVSYYQDIHLSHMGPQVSQGFLGKLNAAVIEVTAITESGDLIPSSSVGMNRTYLEHADKVIIEVNEWQSEGLFGMHDIYYPIGALPPNRVPLPIQNPGDRIGGKYLTVDPEKVIAIIVTNSPDRNTPFKHLDDDSRAIAGNFLDFLGHEVKVGRLPENLLPLQSGVGNIANAVLQGLLEGPFENLTSYTEVIQDGMVDLLDSGKLSVASATAFSLSPKAAEKMNDNAAHYAKKIVLRPQDVSNHPEAIRRMGVIACNGMIEADIYGNVNSTHVMGSRMQNGIGGSGDFTRNGWISSFVTPSTAKGGAISCIVPMVNHVDHTEHDVQVIITEQGLADLRGLAPRLRAKAIIDNCAHPDFKEPLREYVKLAEKKANGMHTPHDLATALGWHVRFLETGTMAQ